MAQQWIRTKEGLHGLTIVEVGWPSDPIEMVLDSEYGDQYFVAWSSTLRFDLPGPPVSRLQKLWPAGDQGSNDPPFWDFRLIPDVATLDYAGRGIAQTSHPGILPLMEGPYFKADGSLILDADRPALGYALRRIVSSQVEWYAAVAVLPTLDKTNIGVTYNGVASSYGINIVDRSGTLQIYSASTGSDHPGAVASLASQINADDTVSASSSSLTLTLTRSAEGYPIAFGGVTGLSSYQFPSALSYGGLSVDQSGNYTERLEV